MRWRSRSSFASTNWKHLAHQFSSFTLFTFIAIISLLHRIVVTFYSRILHIRCLKMWRRMFGLPVQPVHDCQLMRVPNDTHVPIHIDIHGTRRWMEKNSFLITNISFDFGATASVMLSTPTTHQTCDKSELKARTTRSEKKKKKKHSVADNISNCAQLRVLVKLISPFSQGIFDRRRTFFSSYFFLSFNTVRYCWCHCFILINC